MGIIELETEQTCSLHREQMILVPQLDYKMYFQLNTSDKAIRSSAICELNYKNETVNNLNFNLILPLEL